MPKISIIIPVYNVEKYLSRCLNSVLKQTFNDWEAICINDESPDNCCKILDQFAKKDSRFKIITQKNQGVSISRNNGLKEAKGDYIYFLDSDDAMHPQLLDITYNLAKQKNADWVCFGFEKSNGIEYEPKKISEDKIKYKITNNPLYINKGRKNKISVNVWSKLYRKELIKDLNFIPNIHFQDYPYTYAIMAKKPKTILINKSLVYYTINYNSISNQKINPKQIKDYHLGINYIYETYTKLNLSKELLFIKKNLIPNKLKQQLKLCKKADENIKNIMIEEFSKELKDLNSKNIISWRGHQFNRYLTYKKLIK
jgi:glycosyltransferase involved in cell wall biosynthesis